jgi:transposase
MMSQQNELPQEPLPTEVSPQGLNLLYETLAHSPYRKAEKRLKRLQRRHSRKQKKSANRKKARKALAKQHLKVQRQREDFDTIPIVV